MHYNIALLPKKVTNYVSYLLWKVMRYITFALLSHYFLNMSRAWLFVFNTRSYIYSKCKSPFTPKSVMNKPQAEGRVNSRLYSRTQEKIQHSSEIKNNEAQLLVYLNNFCLLVWLNWIIKCHLADDKTLVDKMGLDIFVLFNIFNYCRFASYSEFCISLF